VCGILGEATLSSTINASLHCHLSLCRDPKGFQNHPEERHSCLAGRRSLNGRLVGGLGPCSLLVWSPQAGVGRRGQISCEPTQCGPNPILMASGLCSGQAAHLCPCQPASPCPPAWTQATLGLLSGRVLRTRGATAASPTTHAHTHTHRCCGSGGSCQDPQAHRKAKASGPG
jgi:hypothetical protein